MDDFRARCILKVRASVRILRPKLLPGYPYLSVGFGEPIRSHLAKMQVCIISEYYHLVVLDS